MSKPDKKLLPEPAPRALDEHLAITLAHAAAGSTFELARVREGNHQLVNGRCWYAAGRSFETPVVAEHVAAWVEFVGVDKDMPAEALWRHVHGKLKLRCPVEWPEQPLSTRMAFSVFVETLVPLLTEARAAAKRAAAAVVVPDVPLPDKGPWKRSLTRRGGNMSKRVVMSAPKLEAAE